MKVRAWRAGVVALGVSILAGGLADASTQSEVLALTGDMRAKFVWCSGWDYHLKTFDTDTGTINAILHKGTGGTRYNRPLISADGLKIFYLNSDNESAPETHVCNFDGTGDSVLLTDTWLGDVWRDPNTQKDYVIGVVGSKLGDVYKIEVENTSNRTLIWDKTPAYIPTGHDEIIEWGWLTMSPDGEYICSAFPFMGGCGVGVIKTVNPAQPNYFRGAGTGHEGCWTCIVPDDTHRFMTLNYAHDAWWFNTAPATTEQTVTFTSVPDPEGDNTNDNVYYTQFTNDPRFVVCSENYDDGNTKHEYVCKLNASLTAVTDWVTLCDQSQPAWNIDGWIDPGSSPPVDPAMSFSPVSLTFSAEVGAGDPPSQTIDVTNTGGGTLDTVTVSGEPAWLTVNRTGSGDAQDLENVVDVTGLAVGTYNATITVTCANADPTTKTYSVTLNITNPGRDPENPSDAIPGLIVAYYATAGGNLPADFGPLQPIRRRLTTDPINYPSTTGEFATSGRSDNVSALFDGFVNAPTFGEYTFYVESDAGSALYIGTTEVVDNDGAHSMTEASGSIWLKAGWHDVSVRYTEDTGSAGLVVRYEGPGVSKQVIPASSFTTNDWAIDLVSPVGGEVWYIGTTRYIQWEAFNVDNVQVHISRDNGGGWAFPDPVADFTSIATNNPNWGYFPYVVSGTTSTQCLITVSAYIDGAVPMTSKNTFEIRAYTDTDADGMADAWETDHFTNTSRDGAGDFDGDGVTDLDEFNAGSDPTQSDGDGDGMPDAWEIEYGTNPGADDAHLDPDGDGVTNFAEYLAGTDPRGNDGGDDPAGLSCGARPDASAWSLVLLVAAAAFARRRSESAARGIGRGRE